MKRWEIRFLRSLRSSPNVALACQRAKISRQTAYRSRAENPDFAEAWKETLESALDELETVAFALAKRGDQQLLTWLLRSHRPQLYRETTRTEIGIAAKLIIIPGKVEGSE